MYERAIYRYKRWYAALLKLYPKSYYDRFGESMAQTFGDLCRDHARTSAELFGFVVWMLVETSLKIISKNLQIMTTPAKKVTISLIISTALLIMPIIASQFVEGWLWSMSDYVFAWMLFSFVSLAGVFVVTSTRNILYKTASGIAVIATFLLIWINGAVGIIGDSDINLLYAIVVFVLLVGSIAVRFKADKLSTVLFAAALVQFLVPVTALVVGEPDFSPGIWQVVLLNGFWVVSFVTSGILFRQGHAN